MLLKIHFDTNMLDNLFSTYFVLCWFSYSVRSRFCRSRLDEIVRLAFVFWLECMLMMMICAYLFWL